MAEERLTEAIKAHRAAEQTRTRMTVPARAAFEDPRVQNDRASTYLARWQRTRSLEDAVAAYEAARNAVSSDPKRIEARFNLALALEAMSSSFQDEARQAWKSYLDVDSTSSRARESRRHLKALNAGPRTMVQPPER